MNSATESSSPPPRSRFNPLRSIPWFQLGRLDFEQTRRTRLDPSEEYALQDVEKTSKVTEIPMENDHEEGQGYAAAGKPYAADTMA